MTKPLSDTPALCAVMIDANIVIYALFSLTPYYHSCKNLLERSARQEIQLYMVTHAVADVIHRAMIIEAAELIPNQQPVSYLKQHPQLVRQLKRYKTILRELSNAKITILPISYKDLHTSKKYRDNYGLLANDSLIVAVMEREKITYLATNDPDFARVPGISVRQPE